MLEGLGIDANGLLQSLDRDSEAVRGAKRRELRRKSAPLRQISLEPEPLMQVWHWRAVSRICMQPSWFPYFVLC